MCSSEVRYSVTKWIIYICLFAFGFAENQDFLSEKEMNGLMQQMLEAYDWTERSEIHKPLDLDINWYIQDLWAVDEVNMDYKLNIFFRQTWVDTRLAWGNLTSKRNGPLPSGSGMRPYQVDAKYANQIWKADLFLYNEKDAHRNDILEDQIYLEVGPEGTVMLSQRVTMQLHCSMKLRKFPFDTQVCELLVESYALRDYQLRIRWADGEPIQFNSDLAIVSFQLKDVLVQKECLATYITGNFSCVKGYFVLERDYGYYTINCFLPSFMCVISSWFAFWIELDCTPARVTLGIATYFTISTMTQTFNAGLPKLSYIKSIDIWMIGCNIFVFLTLLEYCIAQMTVKWDRDRRSRHTRKLSDFARELVDERHYHWLDKISQIAFPIAYFIFIIIYWLTLDENVEYPEGVFSIKSEKQ